MGDGGDGRSAPQTPFALGNAVGRGAGFTSEKMRGADAVFGSNNVAAVFPVTDAAILVNYPSTASPPAIRRQAAGKVGTQ